jgi:hypothetical protein
LESFSKVTINNLKKQQFPTEETLFEIVIKDNDENPEKQPF